MSKKLIFSDLKSAIKDIYIAVLRYELWLTLGWRDVLGRFRRSLLGTLWIPLGMAIVAGVMGFLYSTIMQRSPETYIPYLATGFIIWNMLSAMLTEGTNVFVTNSNAIKEIPVPVTVYVFRVVWRSLIIFAHNLILYIAILFIFQISPFPAIFLALPALVLILLNGLWVSLLFGIINVRFRDFNQVVNNSIRLIFFLTPIIWYRELATGVRELFVQLNPFYYFIEILRSPMLGIYPEVNVWIVVSSITIIGWTFTLFVYAKYRHDISYWV